MSQENPEEFKQSWKMFAADGLGLSLEAPQQSGQVHHTIETPAPESPPAPETSEEVVLTEREKDFLQAMSTRQSFRRPWAT